MERLFAFTTCLLAIPTIAFAGLTDMPLTADELEEWEFWADGSMLPEDADETGWCAVLWDMWLSDLEKTGNAKAFPASLGLTSARIHAKAYDDAYGELWLEENPGEDPVGQFGPIMDAMTEAEEMVDEYGRLDFIAELGSCYYPAVGDKLNE